MSRAHSARVWTALTLGFALALATVAGPARAEEEDLMELDLASLADLDIVVTSVSKKAQSIHGAAAAIAVITDEDIRRSGATSIPEALRMVPGMEVARITANTWAITARGFNSDFANKLLVLIDGRSVYTPLFAGVYWDVQDVVLEDIERIEVIRGPGATVWGANAVNGVINIITKDASKTQGAMAQYAFGNYEGHHGVLRYGGAVGEDLHYRAYVKYFNREDFKEWNAQGGGQASDEWDQGRAGFRMDWRPTENDHINLQGDAYIGNSGSINSVRESLAGPQTVKRTHADTHGWNVTTSWSHDFSETHNATLQLYWDRTDRNTLSFGEVRDTVDVDFQHSFALPLNNSVIWGLGYRWGKGDYRHDSWSLMFTDDGRTDNLYSAFIQNEFEAIEDTLRFTVGTKVEHNEFTGWEFQPSARFSWTPNELHTVWGSVSRAVRTPSIVDHDLRLDAGLTPGIFTGPCNPIGVCAGYSPNVSIRIMGDTDFESETVKAFELGWRFKPWENVSLDFAAYYNHYEKLTAFDSGDTITLADTTLVPTGFPGPFPPAAIPLPTSVIAPVVFRNQAEGYAAGFEFLGTWQVTERWRLTATYTFINVDEEHKDRTMIASFFDPTERGNSDRDVPSHQVGLRSHLELPFGLSLDTNAAWIGRVKTPDIDPYWKVDARVAWAPTEWLTLEAVGLNLVERWHKEYTATLAPASMIPRQAYVRATVNF